MPLTWLDILLIAIMLISGLLAMMRGFNREALTVFAWGGAGFAAWVMFPILKEPIREKLDPNILADTVNAGGVFIMVLVIISVISMRFADVVLDSQIGALDRTFGFIFGIVRGFLLVTIAFLFFNWLVRPQTQPQWVTDARTHALLKETGNSIMSWMPDEFSKNFSGFTEGSSGGSDKTDQEQTEEPGVIPEEGDAGSESNGYQKKERQGLNQLFESSTSSQ